MIERDKATLYSIRAIIVVMASLLLYGGLFFVGRRSESANSITVYAYSDMLCKEVFDDFEKETGVRVTVKLFDAVEEVTAKLMFANEESVDIIAPTDSMVEVLRNEGFLAPLDKKQLPSFGSLDSRLLGHYYDEKSDYSVPYCWSPVGIGYDTRVIKEPLSKIEWDLIFGVEKDGKRLPPSYRYGVGVDRVCLGEDPWETLFLSAHHLYGSIQNLTAEKRQTIIELLSAQREWLECYTNNLKYFLISGVCAAVVMPAAYMIKMQSDYPWAEFVIPADGGAVFIGNLMISKTCKNMQNAHKVIEFLLSVKGGLACFAEHAYNPANKKAYKLLPPEVAKHRYLFPDNTLFSKLHIFHNQVPLSAVEQLWHAVKL